MNKQLEHTYHTSPSNFFKIQFHTGSCGTPSLSPHEWVKFLLGAPTAICVVLITQYYHCHRSCISPTLVRKLP